MVTLMPGSLDRVTDPKLARYAVEHAGSHDKQWVEYEVSHDDGLPGPG